MQVQLDSDVEAPRFLGNEMLKLAAKSSIVKPLALCAALLAAGVTTAQAQSSVVIYGRIDAGINYQSNVDTGARDSSGNAIRGAKWGVDGNDWGTSMFGFKGTEDLGGGLKAIFNLESGFDASTGSVNGGEGLWTRRAFVGLTGSAGTVKVGKDLSIQSDPIWAIDPTGQQAISTATLVKERNWPQTNNMISYETPNYGGFTATYMHGFGEQAGSFKNGSKDGLSLAFVQPTYSIRAIYDVQRDADGKFSSLYNHSKEFILGGTLTVNKAKLFAGFENLRADADPMGVNPDRANLYWLGVNYQLTPVMELIGAAYHTNVNKSVGNANLFMVGTNYSLSKRTKLYASVGTVRNGANSDFSVEYGNGGVKGENQNAFYAGISHSF
jgi:predicted porin